MCGKALAGSNPARLITGHEQQGEETQHRRVQDASAETVRIAGTMDSKPNVPRLLRRHNASDVSSSRRITERVVVDPAPAVCCRRDFASPRRHSAAGAFT